jgi:hypothetical protein
MITNKLLLSSIDEDEIPFKPFPDGEQRKYILDDDTIEYIFYETPFFMEQYPFQGFSGIELPKNRCTIIIGITDESFEKYVQSHNGISQQEELDVYGDCMIGPTSDYSYKSILEFTKNIDINNWTPSYTEVYVQLDFESKTDFTFYPFFITGPILAKYKLQNGNEVTSYLNVYVRMSNEIHEHGPYNNDDYENPLIIKIASLG